MLGLWALAVGTDLPPAFKQVCNHMSQGMRDYIPIERDKTRQQLGDLLNSFKPARTNNKNLHEISC
jgi:acetyl-CoA carboxylase beta subunit